VASVTSALQRARATMRQNAHTETRPPSAGERELVARYIDAHHRADAAALVALMRADVRFTMPPQPAHYEGIAEVGAFMHEALGVVGEFRLVPTRANRMPALANYLKAPDDTEFRALALDLLRVVDGALAEITTFEPHLFVHFGLPEIWRDAD
jgi:RNA polymerase sigma-70 factor (ECF subfamily)